MILVLIEHDGGALNPASLEMLTLARHLAEFSQKLPLPPPALEQGSAPAPNVERFSKLVLSEAERSFVEGVIIGESGRSLAGRLAGYGLDRIHLVQHERLDDYAPVAWARGLAQLVQSLAPEVVLAAGTDQGHEVMAHLAAQMDLPLATNCIEVRPGEPYQLTRLRWGGSLLEESLLKGEPKLLTAALHTFPVAESTSNVERFSNLFLSEAERSLTKEPALELFRPSLEEKDFRVRVTGRVASATEGVSLTDARVVIGGGRGVGGPEGFELLERLADLLGGAVGASRVATNNGWRPHAVQIGQTGTRIAPDLYIACGISGAIQHIVGCRGAKRILAINKDREAPIIARSDYAVIGDLHEIVPALIAKIRASKDAGAPH